MQTNLHRVSEVAVTAKGRTNEGNAETRSAIKRLRELDSDTESDVDEIAGGTKISTSPVLKVNMTTSANGWSDPLNDGRNEVENTVFLSFDWENEDLYEKTVERY